MTFSLWSTKGLPSPTLQEIQEKKANQVRCSINTYSHEKTEELQVTKQDRAAVLSRCSPTQSLEKRLQPAEPLKTKAYISECKWRSPPLRLRPVRL